MPGLVFKGAVSWQRFRLTLEVWSHTKEQASDLLEDIKSIIKVELIAVEIKDLLREHDCE